MPRAPKEALAEQPVAEVAIEEAKRQRKAAKRTAEALAAEPDVEAEAAEAKRQRKAAKKAAAAAATEVEADVDPAEAKRQRKAAKKALEAAADAPAPPAAAGIGLSKGALKRKAKKEKRAEAKTKALAQKNPEMAARTAANAALRKKGKKTKKELYLANKAVKKKAAAQLTDGRNPSSHNVEELLKAAGLDRVDPRAVECFLTGLAYMATQKHIADHFEKASCTSSSVELLRDAETGRPNGKAFVTFASAEDALKACALTGSKIQNRWINVRLCEVRDNGKRKAPGGINAAGHPSDPGEKPEGCLSVIVNCDKSVSEASLRRFFEDCHVTGVSRMMDKTTGEFRGMAFLDFEDSAMVDKAVAKNGLSIKSHPIRVRFKADRSKEKESDAGAAQASKDAAAAEKKESKDAARGNRIAAHNRAPPVPPPSGTATKLDSDSDSDS